MDLVYPSLPGACFRSETALIKDWRAGSDADSGIFGGHMAKLFYASVLALLLFTSGVLSSAFSQSINVETNNAIQSTSEEDALKEAAELIRQSRRGSNGLAAAERGLVGLLEAHSDSTIAALLATLLDGVRDKRAEVDLSIAMYYLYN